MSERAPSQEFRAEHLLPTAEQAEPLRPGERDPVQQIAEADTSQLAAEARQTIAEHGPTKVENPLQKLEAEETAASEASRPTLVNAELKKITLKRELKAIQRRLPARQRLLSKTIHQPVVRVASEAAGRTLARPSGLLGGGAMAFLGTTLYVGYAKYIGLTYNYTIFLLLFAAGFALGLILEVIVWSLTARRRAAE